MPTYFHTHRYDNRDWEFFPVGECFMKQVFFSTYSEPTFFVNLFSPL